MIYLYTKRCQTIIQACILLPLSGIIFTTLQLHSNMTSKIEVTPIYLAVPPSLSAPQRTLFNLINDVKLNNSEDTLDKKLSFNTFLFSYYPHPHLNLTSSFDATSLDAASLSSQLRELESHLRSADDGSQIRCRRIVTIGGWSCERRTDGVKPVCLETLSSPGENMSCLVYSFGVGNDFSFERKISDFGCHVFVFDDDKVQNYDTVINDRILFFKVRLGTLITVLDARYTDEMRDYTFLYRPLDNIMFLLGHDEAYLDILKIDIEGDEWKVFGESICKSDILPRTKQVILEVHLEAFANFTNTTEMELERSIHKYNEVFKCLKSNGFELVTSLSNELRPTLSVVLDFIFQVYSEQLWINTNFQGSRTRMKDKDNDQGQGQGQGQGQEQRPTTKPLPGFQRFHQYEQKDLENYRTLIENLN